MFFLSREIGCELRAIIHSLNFLKCTTVRRHRNGEQNKKIPKRQPGSGNSFYLRRSRQIREKKVLFLLGILGGLLFSHPCTLKMGVSQENFSLKWVYPEKTFLQNGCIQRKLFFKMGISRENFSSKWVHLQKNFCCKMMHQDKI